MCDKKMWIQTWVNRVKSYSHVLYSVFTPFNQALVGGVSVNTLCQQSGLFVLSVSRYSVKGLQLINESNKLAL